MVRQSLWEESTLNMGSQMFPEPAMGVDSRGPALLPNTSSWRVLFTINYSLLSTL